MQITFSQSQISCDGRVVKALDLKSNGIFPRRFEPCSQRHLFWASIKNHISDKICHHILNTMSWKRSCNWMGYFENSMLNNVGRHNSDDPTTWLFPSNNKYACRPCRHSHQLMLHIWLVAFQRFYSHKNSTIHEILLNRVILTAVMAEWLRRWTWNPMGSSRAGSNPARSDIFYIFANRLELGNRLLNFRHIFAYPTKIWKLNSFLPYLMRMNQFISQFFCGSCQVMANNCM